MAQGLVHLYCGDGKGKTTAALGLALRAAGHGLKVMLVQFLKSADTGELKVLPNLPGCRVIRGKGGQKFSSAMSAGEKAETCLIHNQNLQTAIAEAKAGNCDVLILDEAVSALSRGMLNREELIGFIKDKPPGLELILTGRDPDPELLELADYVTKMKKVKHPFDRGIKARRGIEK